MAYMRLGDLLISTGAISREQLEQALELQKGTKQRLGDSKWLHYGEKPD